MEEDTIIDASLDDFAASSSASPEIDHEYEPQTGSGNEVTGLRRSSRLRSKRGLSGSTSSVTTVSRKQSVTRSEKKKKMTKSTQSQGEHLNDSSSADPASSALQHRNGVDEDAMNYSMSLPPPDAGADDGLATNAQLENSLVTDIMFLDDDDVVLDDDDDDDDDDLDLAFHGAPLHDFDADKQLNMYLGRSLPVSLPVRPIWGLTAGISETDFAAEELSFVRQLADLEKQQESDAGDGVGEDEMDMSIQYGSDDERNEVANEQPDERVEMHVRDAMNGELGAPRRTPSPSPDVEFGDDMGNQFNGATTPESSSREGSPESWSPPGYGYTYKFRKTYVQKMGQAQHAMEKQMKQATQPPQDKGRGTTTESGHFSESSGSSASVSESSRQDGVMLPPSTTAADTMPMSSNVDSAMPGSSMQERSPSQYNRASSQSSSRSSSVDKSYATFGRPIPEPVQNSIAMGRFSPDHRPSVEHSPNRKTPPRDIFPRRMPSSPSGSSRNSNINRSGILVTSPSASHERLTIRPAPKSPGALGSQSRAQSPVLMRASSIPPMTRPGDELNQLFQESAWIRQRSSASPSPQNPPPNYARFAMRSSPPPPPLPPTPIQWMGSSIPPKQISKSDPSSRTNSKAGLDGTLMRKYSVKSDSALSELEEAVRVPLPRGSLTPEPSSSSRNTPDPYDDRELYTSKHDQSSPSPAHRDGRSDHSLNPQNVIREELLARVSSPLPENKKMLGTRLAKPMIFASQSTIKKLMSKVGTLPPSPKAISIKRPNFTFQTPKLSAPSWLTSMFSGWSKLRIASVICFFASLLLMFIRIKFAPPPLRPIPDIEKLVDLAKALEPMIYYSDNGYAQIKYLRNTELAVWDLGESMRSANMSSAQMISQELDDLSGNLQSLGTELRRFFTMVDSDIDSVLASMDWTQRHLENLHSVPSPERSSLIAVVDGVHSFFGRIAVLDNINSDLLEQHLEKLGKGNRNDLFTRNWVLPLKSLTPQPTAFGSVMREIFGITWEQRTLKVLTQTFAELLGSLEEAITGELEQAEVLFSLFESIDEQFMRLSGHIGREDTTQVEHQGELLSGLWSKFMGPNKVLYRRFERNRKLLSSLRSRTVANKGFLMDTRGKLMGLKLNLEILRKRLVKPLLRPEAFKRLFADDGKALATKVGNKRPEIEGASGASYTEDDSAAHKPMMSAFSISEEEDPNIMTLEEPLPALLNRRIDKIETTRKYLFKLRQKQKKKVMAQITRREQWENPWKGLTVDDFIMVGS
ncbi:putative 26S proteasome regulatory subunit [Ascosphaera pollenicola]|nr:putative 26S proteasome regulatory subunit [Ascosphaera pollenicola]